MANKTTLSSSGGGKGFLQSTVSVGGRSLTQRSWLIGGRLYNRLYQNDGEIRMAGEIPI